jgi:hypothetical protein
MALTIAQAKKNTGEKKTQAGALSDFNMSG